MHRLLADPVPFDPPAPAHDDDQCSPRERRLREAWRGARKRVKQLVRTSTALTQAFDLVPSILVVFSASGHILHWNETAHRTFNLGFNDVRGKHFTTCGICWLEPAEVIDALLLKCNSELRSEHPFELGGAKRWLGLTMRNVPHADGTVGHLLSGSDITSRREADEQNRQTHKLEAIGQLAAGIAHEINTPTQYVGDNITFLQEAWPSMQSIVNCALALRNSTPPVAGSDALVADFDRAVAAADLDFVLPEFPNALAQAREGTRRIAHIVRAMKEFSHPGSREKTELNLNHAVENTVAISRSEWKYVAELHTELDATLPDIPCYPGEIGQVILNLLVNASHSIQEKLQRDGDPGPGTITIVTRRADDAVELLISDTGTGIPESIRARIFELFFTTKEVGKGTGQGLAFVHSVIVKKHGGQLWVDSEVGRGSTFGIRLPLAPAA